MKKTHVRLKFSSHNDLYYHLQKMLTFPSESPCIPKIKKKYILISPEFSCVCGGGGVAHACGTFLCIMLCYVSYITNDYYRV